MNLLNPVPGVASMVPELSAHALRALEGRYFRRDERQSAISTSEFGRLKDRRIVCERLSHPAIHGIYVTDSVSAPAGPWPGLNVVFLAPWLAAAIRRFRSDESIGDLYAQVIHSGGGALSAPSGSA